MGGADGETNKRREGNEGKGGSWRRRREGEKGKNERKEERRKEGKKGSENKIGGGGMGRGGRQEDIFHILHIFLTSLLSSFPLFSSLLFSYISLVLPFLFP